MLPRSIQAVRKKSSLKADRCLPIFVFLLFSACDQLPDFSVKKPVPLAEQAASNGDFPAAVRFYESALDGTEGTAEIHYRLAIIYDKNLSDPVSALHHYRRYSRMAEKGEEAQDVTIFIQRLERDLVARIGEGGVVSRAEAIRLRNENNSLREQLVAFRGQKAQPATAVPPVDAKGFSKVPQTKVAEANVGAETRTYTVQKGDTLAAISRKFFNTSERWKDIVDANHNQLQGGTNIREGQVLIIP